MIWKYSRFVLRLICSSPIFCLLQFPLLANFLPFNWFWQLFSTIFTCPSPPLFTNSDTLKNLILTQFKKEEEPYLNDQSLPSPLWKLFPQLLIPGTCYEKGLSIGIGISKVILDFWTNCEQGRLRYKWDIWMRFSPLSWSNSDTLDFVGFCCWQSEITFSYD